MHERVTISHMKIVNLGYSPCPNDTFIFFALIHGRIPFSGLSFREILLDVEELNIKAMQGQLDISKVSYAMFGQVSKEYILLRSGGALGRGCGPLIVSKQIHDIEDLNGKTIGVPGLHTTAYLLLNLFNPSLMLNAAIRVMPFHEIISAISRGTIDAGLIIHESRFTYDSYGLHDIIDLGEWWERETKLPIPLGAIIAKRSLGETFIKQINDFIKSSILYACGHRSETLSYIQQHAQELSPDVIGKHIDLYVNDFSLDVGAEGEKAVRELLMRAVDAGVMEKVRDPIFI